MNGAAYRALTRFSNRANETIVDLGETCEKLSSAALDWAVRTGRVEQIEAEPLEEVVVPTADAAAADLRKHADELLNGLQANPSPAAEPPATEGEK